MMTCRQADPALDCQAPCQPGQSRRGALQIRAAFAVHFLETYDGDLEALQALIGHGNVETTQV